MAKILIACLAVIALLSGHASAWSVRWKANATAGFFGLPQFEGERVIICADAKVLALSNKDGTQLWKGAVGTPCQYIATSPKAAFVGSNEAINAFDIETGKPLWQYSFNGTGGVPARPTFAEGKVFFTVENGGNSTHLHVLSAEKGELVFKSNSLASTRIWFTVGLVVYVEIASATNASQTLVAREARDPHNVIWSRASDASLPLSNGGGTVAFEGTPIIAMLSPPNAIGIAVLRPWTGETMSDRTFSPLTSNFDFNIGLERWFTIESYGAPNYANSTISSFDFDKAEMKWSHNITSVAPNLAPASKGKDGYILAQGGTNIVAFDERDGRVAFNYTFPNPGQIIGSGVDGVFVIGNSVESVIYAFDV